MLGFFGLLASFMDGLVGLLEGVVIFGDISLWDIIFGFLFIYFVASVFWKGARA